MKITRANVEKYAEEKGLEPIQIDGMPEGFSFIEPDITIGEITHSGRLLAFVPNCEWASGAIMAENIKDLLDVYNNVIKIRDGK